MGRRIALITSVHPAFDARIFYKEAVSFAVAGNVVTLFAQVPTAQIAQHRAHAANFGVQLVPVRPAASRIARLRVWRDILRALSDIEADVWHMHDPEMLLPLLVWRLVLDKRVSIVYDAHENVPLDMLDKPWIAAPLRRPAAWLMSLIEKWAVRRCDLTIAATDVIANRLRSAASRIVTVRNYPRPGLAARPAPELGAKNTNAIRPVKAIYVGALTKLRGIRQIIDAVSLIRPDQLALTIVGAFDDPTFALAMRERAPGHVRFVEAVPHEQVTSYLSESEIGIVALLPAHNHIDALPVKLFEYMQAGLAVVASDFPLWREIVDGANGGVLVDPVDPAAIAAALTLLVGNASLRRAMGIAGQKAVQERYSWQTQAEAMLKAYDTLPLNADVRKQTPA
jgi:glycosyltransferase involved in cell wall biosynthesis